MTYYSDTGKPLSKKLEKQINEEELSKILTSFIKHLHTNHKEEQLTPANIHELFIKLYGKTDLGMLRLMRKLRDTGNFPASKVMMIKGKSVRLYHIR